MDELPTVEQRLLEHRLAGLNAEIDSADDVLMKLDLIQRRRTLLNSICASHRQGHCNLATPRAEALRAGRRVRSLGTARVGPVEW